MQKRYQIFNFQGYEQKFAYVKPVISLMVCLKEIIINCNSKILM